MNNQAFYNHMILVDPTDSLRNILYLGGQLFSAKSTDGGATWSVLTSWLGSYKPGGTPGAPIPEPYVHADFHCAAFTSIGGTETVFFGNDGGLFYSTDGGKSWLDNANNGLVTYLIYAMTNGTQHPDNILIGLQDNGTRYRVSTTTTYNGSIGGDGIGVGWSQANNDFSWGSVPGTSLRRFDNNPPNVQNKYKLKINGINRTGAPFFTSLITPTAAADPTGHVFYTTTSRRLYKTTNAGENWAEIFNVNTSVPPGQTIRGVVHPVGVSPTDLNFVGVAGTASRVFVTHNGGSSWTKVSLQSAPPVGVGALWQSFNSSVSWASNNAILYLSSVAPFTGIAHVAKSVDGGDHWTAFTPANGLPDTPVEIVLVDPRDAAGDIVYAGTWVGVYRTTDGGAHWSLFGAGLPQVVVSDLYLMPDGSALRISTYGRGVWEVKL